MSLAKVVLNDIGTLANGASARQALNDNFQKIEDEFKKVVYRDGSTPNSMEADLDMDSHRILNVADAVHDKDAVNKGQVADIAYEAAEVVWQPRFDDFVNHVEDELSRTLKLPPGYTNMALPAPEPSRLIGWNAAGTGLRNNDLSGPGDLMLRSDLADPTGGAALVQYDDDETVKDRLDALASGGGAALVGFQQAGAGAVVRNAQDKMREWVTPEDFGAVGDGVADDTVPVQTAIDVGRVVRFRPGATYRITSSLIVPSHTTIIAHGAKVIRGASGLTALLLNYADGVTGGWDAATNITIDGGDWDGGDDSQGPMSVMAFGHCNRVTVRNLTIRRVPHFHHIEVNSSSDVLIDNCRFLDGAAYSVVTGEAIQIDHASNNVSFPWFGPWDGTPCRGIRITNCIFSYNGSGIGTHSAPGTSRHEDIVIENCAFFGIYGYGIRMMQWSGVRVVNCRFQSCYTGIYMQSFNGQVPRGVLIQGNTFYNIGAGGNPGTGGVCINIEGAPDSARYADVAIVNNFLANMDGTHGASAIVAFYTDRLMVEGNTITSPVVHGMWLQGIKNSVISGNSCYGAVSPNFDIRLGYAGSSAVTSNNVVTGNACGRIGVSNTTRCLVRGNIANSVDVTGTHTESVTTGNLVAGTMT